MRPALVAAAVIAAIGGVAFVLMRPSEPSPHVTPEVPGERVEAVPPLRPVAAPATPTPPESVDAGARATAPAAAAPAAAAPAAAAPAAVAPSQANTKPITAAELADLKLTRTLTGEHRFTQGGRPHTVLGTKDTEGANGGTQAMLVTRDQVSGQITYSLPALQFTLNGGVDADAFIAEHPHMTKRFANPMYLQVDLDAANVASELEAAARDPRVAKVGFVPLPTKKSTR